MFLPFFWNLSASPKPNTPNFIGLIDSVDSEHGESVFSKVIDVPQITIFEVVCEVTDNAFT